jgi:hypothetical protein
MSEMAFLNQQAAQARAALSRSADGMAQNAAVVVNPRVWVKEHPWKLLGIPAMSLGAISALSFFLMHKKKKQRKGFFSRFFSQEAEPQVRPEKPKPWWMFLLQHALSILQPALFSAVASAVSSRFGQHNGAPSQDRGGQVL